MRNAEVSTDACGAALVAARRVRGALSRIAATTVIPWSTLAP
jgi:hypothetical protein